jgi:hypothetical protein
LFTKIYRITFGCKEQIKIKKQIPNIVTIVIVRSTIANRSIRKRHNECQLLIDHILILLLTSLSNVIPNGVIIGNKRRRRRIIIHMQVARKQ